MRALRMYIIGVRNLIVEVDARYIKGMLQNPDIVPSAVSIAGLSPSFRSTSLSYTFPESRMDQTVSHVENPSQMMRSTPMTLTTSKTGSTGFTVSSIKSILSTPAFLFLHFPIPIPFLVFQFLQVYRLQVLVKISVGRSRARKERF